MLYTHSKCFMNSILISSCQIQGSKKQLQNKIVNKKSISSHHPYLLFNSSQRDLKYEFYHFTVTDKKGLCKCARGITNICHTHRRDRVENAPKKDLF